jgi:hypothetical protein
MIGDAFTLTLLGILGPTGTAALIVGAKHINRRADAHETERTAAATFDAHFIPEAEDVARRQADNDASAELDLVIEELDEALGGLRA